MQLSCKTAHPIVQFFLFLHITLCNLKKSDIFAKNKHIIYAKINW